MGRKKTVKIREDIAQMALALPPRQAGEYLTAAVRYLLGGDAPDVAKMPKAVATLWGISEADLSAVRCTAPVQKKYTYSTDTSHLSPTYGTEKVHLSSTFGSEKKKEEEPRRKKNLQEKKTLLTDVNKAKEENPGSPMTRQTFVKPSLDEVRAYIEANCFSVDAEYFVDHYEANGWVTGANKPMRDWKATVRNWHRRNIKNRTSEPAKAEDFSAYDKGRGSIEGYAAGSGKE